jgi:hypothetical protein
MILTEKVDIKITNQGKYWASLGYNINKQKIISVSVNHLSINSNKKIECKCDVCDFVWIATYQSVCRQKQSHKCYSCSRKDVGIIMNTTNISKQNKSRTGAAHPRFNFNKKQFDAYAYKVRRITEETYVKYKQIINPHNLPRTRCGVENGYQLDHKISIKHGFLFQIDPGIIGQLQNLQMLSWKENRNKSS